jgi:hypothetical protein
MKHKNQFLFWVFVTLSFTNASYADADVITFEFTGHGAAGAEYLEADGSFSLPVDILPLLGWNSPAGGTEYAGFFLTSFTLNIRGIPGGGPDSLTLDLLDIAPPNPPRVVILREQGDFSAFAISARYEGSEDYYLEDNDGYFSLDMNSSYLYRKVGDPLIGEIVWSKPTLVTIPEPANVSLIISSCSFFSLLLLRRRKK